MQANGRRHTDDTKPRARRYNATDRRTTRLALQRGDWDSVSLNTQPRGRAVWASY